MKSISPLISIVVIGMNEEKNLDTTFSAIQNMDYPAEKLELIYCDTGSSDESVNIAKKYTDKVFIEKSNWPTPGLARNRGLLEASHDIVHFIDGDIQIDKNYLKKAVDKIQQSDVDAVYGFLEERSKQGINKILLSHWKNKKEGYSSATGGGGTYKKSCLLRVNGYDERIRKGQETELGERLRKAGYKIWFLNTIMGIHNYGVKSIIDYCKIQIIDGKSKSYNMLLGETNQFFMDIKKRSINNIVVNTFLFIMGAILIILKEFLLLGMGLFIWAVIYPTIKFYVIRKIHDKDRIKSVLLTNITRPLAFWGQITIFVKYLYYSKIKKNEFLQKKMTIKKSLKNINHENFNNC